MNNAISSLVILYLPCIFKYLPGCHFKEHAVRYRKNHSELSLKQAATNLGVRDSALNSWIKVAKESDGAVETRSSSKYDRLYAGNGTTPREAPNLCQLNTETFRCFTFNHRVSGV